MQEKIEQLELDIEVAKSAVELGDCLNRLTKNPDFIKIIMKGYFEEDACRLVRLRASPGMQAPIDQAAILKDIDGIGSLYGYFSKIQQQARLADNAIEADLASIRDIEEEIANGGAE